MANEDPALCITGSDALHHRIQHVLIQHVLCIADPALCITGSSMRSALQIQRFASQDPTLCITGSSTSSALQDPALCNAGAEAHAPYTISQHLSAKQAQKLGPRFTASHIHTQTPPTNSIHLLPQVVFLPPANVAKLPHFHGCWVLESHANLTPLILKRVQQHPEVAVVHHAHDIPSQQCRLGVLQTIRSAQRQVNSLQHSGVATVHQAQHLPDQSTWLGALPTTTTSVLAARGSDTAHMSGACPSIPSHLKSALQTGGSTDNEISAKGRIYSVAFISSTCPSGPT
eukprot:1145209-Pelagomonas_calceolata.AAC.5